MSFPPPSNEPPPSGPGGGFGPPQGFGPPPAPGEYGPPAPRAYAPYPPQRPAGGGNGARIAAVLVGTVVVLAIVIGGIVWLGSGYDDEGARARSAADGPAPVATSGAGAAASGGGGGSSGLPGAAISDGPDTGSLAPAVIPYVKLAPGTCFDSPGLDTSVNVVTKIPCTSPHNGEVISDEHLSGILTSERQLQIRAIALCAPDVSKRLKAMPKNSTLYYDYAFYPNLKTYRTRGEDTVSCTLTLGDGPDGKELTAPLP